MYDHDPNLNWKNYFSWSNWLRQITLTERFQLLKYFLFDLKTTVGKLISVFYTNIILLTWPTTHCSPISDRPLFGTCSNQERPKIAASAGPVLLTLPLFIMFSSYSYSRHIVCLSVNPFYQHVSARWVQNLPVIVQRLGYAWTIIKDGCLTFAALRAPIQ